MKKIILLIWFPIIAFSQGYTSYFTGNTTNITTNPEFGVCMMGGATENDNAMKWLLQKANGGDVVVLRSTGSNGYNDYMYSTLGIPVNSVETIVITSVAGATNPYVLNKVANAEMIWFAGGNQYDYISYFKNNALEDLINAHVTTKHSPIGGTSAGMAILGNNYFMAQNGSITSAQALANPYNNLATLGHNDFLSIPFMSDVITDTHYDNPDRKGRQVAFMARLKTDFAIIPKGIACNEYVAVCIGNDGLAHVYGDYPNYQEFAYFIQTNCTNLNPVENCQSGQTLTWNFGGEALKVYKVPGTMNGANYFDVTNWQSANGSGGSWENWSVTNGVFSSVAGNVPNCALANSKFNQDAIQIFPNPIDDFFTITGLNNGKVTVYDSLGKIVSISEFNSNNSFDSSNLASGIYLLKIENQDGIATKKILKK